jgi:hypothetical protein
MKGASVCSSGLGFLCALWLGSFAGPYDWKEARAAPKKAATAGKETATGGKEKGHEARNKRAKANPKSHDLAQIWALFSWEPSALECQKAAVRHGCLRRKQVRSWRGRVRNAAWLPEVKVGVDRSHGAESRLKGEPGTSSEWAEQKGADLSYGMQARWSLDRLIFDPNELKVSREAQRLVELREEVAHQVTRVYYERRRLQVLDAIRPPRTLRSAALRRLALERLTAALDALTGGWFSRELRRRSRRNRREGRRAYGR